VRYNIIPFLRENLSSDIDSRLCHSAATLREDEALLTEIATEQLCAAKQGDSLRIPTLLKQPLAIQRRLLRLWFFEQNLAAAAGFRSISELITQCGSPDLKWRLQLAENVIVKSDNDLLTLVNQEVTEMLPDIEIQPGETLLWGSFDIKAEISTGIGADSQGVGVFPTSCSLDQSKLQGKTLIVRQRRDGDRINPTGLQGSKKVKDIFIDAKIPMEERDSIPLITCGDEVLWIPGYRISRDYAVTSETAPSIHITVTKSL
jgi:tRNA(Ile)-lysidine synthase